MDVPVEIVVHGDIGSALKAYARDKVSRVTRLVPDPILSAQVTLRVAPNPARERPAIATASLDANGTPVRAHVAAHDVREAIDLLEDRLRDRLAHVATRRQALRRRGPHAQDPHEWRHGDAPTHRPPYFDRPPEEREVVRRRTYADHALSAAEAAEEMDRLDYDFHLFVSDDTGTVCLVSRRSDGRIAIASTGALPPAQEDWLVAEPTPTPTLDEDEAVELLDLSGAPYVFYRDATSGAGAVVYRRYDGHYGLITANGTTPPVHPASTAGA